MKRILLAALGSVSMLAATPALAQGQGQGGPPAGNPGQGMGGGHGMGGSHGMGGMGGMGGIDETGATMRSEGRLNSRALDHANPIAIERANANSVLAGDNVVSGPLTGLNVGDPIFAMVDGTLQSVGTVFRIVPTNSGQVSNVLVRLSDGRVVPLAPGSLSLDTTTNQWTALTTRSRDNRRRN
jgi:hypothetical protein